MLQIALVGSAFQDRLIECTHSGVPCGRCLQSRHHKLAAPDWPPDEAFQNSQNDFGPNQEGTCLMHFSARPRIPGETMRAVCPEKRQRFGRHAGQPGRRARARRDARHHSEPTRTHGFRGGGQRQRPLRERQRSAPREGHAKPASTWTAANDHLTEESHRISLQLYFLLALLCREKAVDVMKEVPRGAGLEC